MSKFTHRHPLSVPGKYYVTDQCIDCDLCRETAPNNFRRDDQTGIVYVFKQPTTPEEIDNVDLSVECCPTDAIGDDGDNPDIHFDTRAPILQGKSRTTMLLNCKVCSGKVSSDATTCPHCGTPNFRNETTEQMVKRVVSQSVGDCPACRVGYLCPMDAGSRGVAFGSGNLLGAFTKSHRCSSCGYLA